MALWAYSYLTLVEAKRVLELNPNDATIDAYVEDLVNAACESVERHLKRFIIRRTAIAEQYDGEGLPHLKLNNGTVAVTSLWDSSTRTFDANSLLDPAADYYVESEEGIVECLDHGRFGDGKRNVKVLYDAGWLLAAVPHPVKKATLMVCQRHHTLDGAGKGLLGVAAASAAGGGSVSPNSQLAAQLSIPEEAKEQLRPYVHHRELGF